MSREYVVLSRGDDIGLQDMTLPRVLVESLESLISVFLTLTRGTTSAENRTAGIRIAVRTSGRDVGARGDHLTP